MFLILNYQQLSFNFKGKLANGLFVCIPHFLESLQKMTEINYLESKSETNSPHVSSQQKKFSSALYHLFKK